MHRIFLGLMVALVVGTILAFMTTYTVRFTETAVVTRAGAQHATKDEPGLHLKLPLIDSVTKYDNRLRLLETRSITQQTADENQLLLEAFATWRVSDPYLFYQRFRNAGDAADQHYEAADTILTSALLSSLAEVSRYRLDELFTQEPAGTKLPELEQRILAALRVGAAADGAAEGEATDALASYGVEVTMVGINRVLLPEETVNRVVERMGANRDRLAQEAESQGNAEATRIISQAESDAEKIRAFAQRRASEIVARGEAEAAEFLAIQNTNADFATFLQTMDFIRDAAAKRATLILPSSSFGLNLFSPSALESIVRGELPIEAPSPGDAMELTGARPAAPGDADDRRGTGGAR